MICKYAVNGSCEISSELAGIPVPLDDKACRSCSEQSKPRALNRVTCLRAGYALKQAGKPPTEEVSDCTEAFKRKTISRGPGTELRKLLPWFSWYKEVDSCEPCSDRQCCMNKWGAVGCQENIEQIVAWILESALENGASFSDRKARLVLHQAIANSEKCRYLEHGICKMASRLAQVSAPVDYKACEACAKEIVPMQANEVTAALACKARERAGLPEDYILQQMSQGVYHLAGYRVERYIHKWSKRLGVKFPENCSCDSWVKKMNEWGVQGSLDHLGEIVEQIHASFKSTHLSKYLADGLAKRIIEERVRAWLLKEPS